ncbi:TPA: hypothetical protein JAJ28_003089 [Aeromonas hydrophila]|uniref:Uncharacterized protein n=1 Tax=Aeromonas hydrophila TaxID=644 RepID=A0AAD3YL95_AERHY|nr:hypothetical protein [Aeromonas hydrophila]
MKQKLLNALSKLSEYYETKCTQLNNYLSLRKLNASIKKQEKVKAKAERERVKFIKSQQFIMAIVEPKSYIISHDNKLYTISINEEGVEVLELITQREVQNESQLITLLMEVNKHG